MLEDDVVIGRIVDFEVEHTNNSSDRDEHLRASETLEGVVSYVLVDIGLNRSKLTSSQHIGGSP